MLYFSFIRSPVWLSNVLGFLKRSGFSERGLGYGSCSVGAPNKHP